MSPKNWTRLGIVMTVAVVAAVVLFRSWLPQGVHPPKAQLAQQPTSSQENPKDSSITTIQGPRPGANRATGLAVDEVKVTQSPQRPTNSGNGREIQSSARAQYYDFTTLDGLIAGTNDPDWKVRWDAVNTLGKKKDPGGIEALTNRALYDNNTHPRWRSLWALKAIDPTGSEAIPVLRDALEDPDPVVAYNAAVALAFFGQPEARPELLKGLNSDNPFVRWESAFSLRQVGNSEVAQALVPLLDDNIEPSDRVRGETALALGYMKSREVVLPLLNVLREDQSPEVRWRAAMTLSRVGDSSVIEELGQMLAREQDSKVKEQIERVLSKFSG